jgi:hypothetical protein
MIAYRVAYLASSANRETVTELWPEQQGIRSL